MKVQVLIKHYLYDDLTNNCLDSLAHNIFDENFNFDILVIDSTPNSTYSYKGIDVVKIPNNIGLIESFNTFISPKYDFYLCLNNDIYAKGYFLNDMVVHIADNIGIYAPMYDSPGGGILELPCPYKPDDCEWESWLDKHLPNTLIETKHVDNCAWGFTKRLVDAIGLPDNNFIGAGWGANLDYCYRARKSGFKVAVNGYTFVHHNHRGTYGKLDSDYVKHAEEARDSYLVKKYGNANIVW